ncbi:MAG: J domain-containing protein [Leptolyngbyaceae bacterium]|nr:J domain-containing protein [Leptolyngbyaceae bacterium]
MSAQSQSYYAILGVSPWASPIEVRRAYRELSKRYHPDTTHLPVAIAQEKFHVLNQAYATLSNPEKRKLYDLNHGYSRVSVMQVPSTVRNQRSSNPSFSSRSAYLDPSDRPLSSGELFAVLLLGATFVGCLLLVTLIGLSNGEITF